MTIQLECITLIIPIAKINECYPGGFRSLIGRDVLDHEDSFSHDHDLYREGGMSPMVIEMRISHWKDYGLTPIRRRKGQPYWKDMCVVDRFGGPTLPCDWLEWDPIEATVEYKPTAKPRHRRPLAPRLKKEPGLLRRD
jgi:hypothetical protein